MIHRASIFAFLLIFAPSCSGTAFATAVEWKSGQVVELQPFLGSTNNEPLSINDSGIVVGASQVGSGFRAVEWMNGLSTNLPGLPGSVGNIAYDINNKGNVVGISIFDDNAVHLVEWINGNIHDLWTLPGGNSFSIPSINDLDQIVVSSGPQAYELIAGTAIALNAPIGSLSTAALGINNFGDIVGFAKLAQDGYYHPIEWSGGAIVKLEAPAGSPITVATDINDSGKIVGETSFFSYNAPVEWIDGQFSFLDYPSGGNAQITSINKDGDIVGYVNEQAAEWIGGQFLYLPTMPSESTSIAFAINNFGTAVGVSVYNPATPELSTWAMLFLGFGSIGLAGCCRARKAGIG